MKINYTGYHPAVDGKFHKRMKGSKLVQGSIEMDIDWNTADHDEIRKAIRSADPVIHLMAYCPSEPLPETIKAEEQKQQEWFDGFIAALLLNRLRKIKLEERDNGSNY